MKAFAPYAEQLRQMVCSWATSRPSDERIHASLNGEVKRELRQRVPIKTLRRSGVFFTGSNLAERLLGLASFRAYANTRFFDPTCGAGDLLLKAASRFPICDSLSETLYNWGARLFGIEKQAHFVETCRLRLAILALSRGVRPDSADLPTLLSGIRVGDALKVTDDYQQADYVLLNPPYNGVSRSLEWANGNVNAASVFVDRATDLARPNARLLSILPEVLRTGARYRKWRERIQERCSLDRIVGVGRFDAETDVDVFLMRSRKLSEKSANGQDWWSFKANERRVGDFFDVHVGPVVPHRHEEVGPYHPFLHARNATAWTRLHSINENRRFRGTVFNGPFLVVRRTSRPNDPQRAVATVVTCAKPVAIENHLIVCLPKCGTIQLCNKLLKMFQGPVANEYFNARIRCRHLTIGSVADCPFHT
ncbi:MAG: SAM-dependent methyltransferase [Pirellulales bacterium]|nr:SAM-dependent methyltransferase [Pirellulales bacterium]